ncbi:hypothetical protein JXR93_13825 [bacterium]|nr:hypothetical protein [bacterium]
MMYFFRKALNNIVRNFSVNLFTILIISTSLMIFNLFLLTYHNIDIILDKQYQHHIFLYLEPDFDENDISKYELEITKKLPSTAVFVSQKEAFNSFKLSLKNDASLLEGLDESVIPAYFDISLKSTPSNLDSILKELDDLYFVSNIDSGKEVYQKIEKIVTILFSILTYIAVLIMIATFFAIYMTIKLTIYSRKEEIEILELVGATRFFIKMPFHIEGVLQGILGVSLAMFMLYLTHITITDTFVKNLLSPFGITTISFIPLKYTLFNYLFSIIFGFLASMFAVNRFLKI